MSYGSGRARPELGEGAGDLGEPVWEVSAEAGSGDDVGDADANCCEAFLYERFSDVLCGLRAVVAVGDARGDVFDLVWLGRGSCMSFDGHEAVRLPLIADADCDARVTGQVLAFDAPGR